MAFRRWFPRSLAQQAAFYENFTNYFAEIAVGLGFTAEDVAKLQADNEMMQYLVNTDFSLKAFKNSFVKFRRNLTTGKGAQTPVYLHYTPPSEPPIVPYGMFGRLFKLVDRVVLADGYTTVIGAQLRILPKVKEALRPEELTLSLKGKALREAQAEIRFVRGDTNGVNLYYQRAGSRELHDLGRFFKSPAIVKIPLTDNKPEQIYIGGRYLIGNNEVGDFSPLIELLIAP